MGMDWQTYRNQNGGDAQNPDTDGDCIHDGDEAGLGNKPSMLISVQTADANLDRIPDNETVRARCHKP